MWKAKVPRKVRAFIWLTTTMAVLMRNNLIKRKWHVPHTYIICNMARELVDHLLIFCPVSPSVRSNLKCVFHIKGMPMSVVSSRATWGHRHIKERDIVMAALSEDFGGKETTKLSENCLLPLQEHFHTSKLILYFGLISP